MTLTDALFFGWLSGVVATLLLVLAAMHPRVPPCDPLGVVIAFFLVAVAVAAIALMFGQAPT